MKKIIILLFFFVITATVFSQQEAQFSQNMFNNMAINPGYAGSNDAICATLLGRQQWVGFKDPQGNKGWPQTYLLSVDGAIKPIHGGFGFTIDQDQLGFEKNLGVKVDYAYRLAVGQGKLGIGGEVGFLDEKIDFTKFIPIQTDDPLLMNGGNQGNIGVDLAFGLFYKIPSKLYFGISADQLSQSEVKYAAPLASPKLTRTYYITAGYYYPLPGNPSLEIDPSLLIKSDLSSTQYDINTLLKYNNRFWGGVGYRVQDAVSIFIGMNWKDFHFGYSYDITTSAIGNYSGGSHEVMLGYCFKVVHNTIPESYKNPRFL